MSFYLGYHYRLQCLNTSKLAICGKFISRNSLFNINVISKLLTKVMPAY